MDKNIKETMLSLEGAALQSAREKYFDYVADARLDRSEPIESDEQAQAEIASVLSEALDDTLHDHTDKLDKLREVNFGPKSAATEGALEVHCIRSSRYRSVYRTQSDHELAARPIRNSRGKLRYKRT